MSMINKEVKEFKVQSFQNGEFKTVTKKDILLLILNTFFEFSIIDAVT